MKILQGSLKETRYEWPKEGESAKMTPTESFDLKRDEVAYMSGKYAKDKSVLCNKYDD